MSYVLGTHHADASGLHLWMFDPCNNSRHSTVQVPADRCCFGDLWPSDGTGCVRGDHDQGAAGKQ